MPEQVSINASNLSEARFHKSVKLGEVLCARSVKPFERGRVDKVLSQRLLQRKAA